MCYTASLNTVTALLEYPDPDCSIRVSQSFLANSAPKKWGAMPPPISTAYGWISEALQSWNYYNTRYVQVRDWDPIHDRFVTTPIN